MYLNLFSQTFLDKSAPPPSIPLPIKGRTIGQLFVACGGRSFSGDDSVCIVNLQFGVCTCSQWWAATFKKQYITYYSLPPLRRNALVIYYFSLKVTMLYYILHNV